MVVRGRENYMRVVKRYNCISEVESEHQTYLSLVSILLLCIRGAMYSHAECEILVGYHPVSSETGAVSLQ